jgi:hypothetical protein
LEERGSSHEGVDEQDSKIYRPCILFIKQSWREVPMQKYRNVVCEDKRTLTLHLCKVGFMPGYEVWTHHGESVHQTVSVAEENDRTCNDRTNGMIDVIRPELERNPEDPSTQKDQKFFDILRASQESLHEQLCSQSVTDRLVSCYHFLIFYTIFLSNLHYWCFL